MVASDFATPSVSGDRRLSQAFQRQFRVARNDVERIVDLVSHARGEVPDARQIARAHQRRLLASTFWLSCTDSSCSAMIEVPRQCLKLIAPVSGSLS